MAVEKARLFRLEKRIFLPSSDEKSAGENGKGF
jgi:hypothetical protein